MHTVDYQKVSGLAFGLLCGYADVGLTWPVSSVAILKCSFEDLQPLARSHWLHFIGVEVVYRRLFRTTRNYVTLDDSLVHNVECNVE